MGIISILTAMVASSAFAARNSAYRAKAQAEIRELTNAMKAYWITYGTWPPEIEAAWSDENTPIPMTKDVLESLRGKGSPGGSHGVNTRQIVFLELSDRQFKNDQYVDPWGTPYEMYFATVGEGDVPDMQFYFDTSVTFPMRDR